MMWNLYLPYRSFFAALTLICSFSLLQAQPTDVRISSERPPGGKQDQLWPGVFEKGGRVFVVWGESRVDSVPPTGHWFYGGLWGKRTEPSADVIAYFHPDSIPPDNDVPRRPLYNTTLGNVNTEVFDGAWVAGVTRLRGDIALPPATVDTVYQARYTVYIAAGSKFIGVKVHEMKRTGGQGVAVLMRDLGYNPNTGEVLTAWKTSIDVMGNVSSVDTSGSVRWSAGSIPFPPGRYNLVPLKDREFLLIIDSVAIRYDNGLPRDTMNFPGRYGLRYQRISGDRFIRSYITDDSTAYVLDIYNVNGTMEKSVQLPWGVAQPSYFITENVKAELEDDVRFAIVSAGPPGVHLQMLRDDFTTINDRVKLNSGTDTTAYAPAATFKEDSIYVVWQDERNGDKDIYGRAYSYRPSTHAVGEEAEAGRRMAVSSIAPNPSTGDITVDLMIPRSSALAVEVIDLTGRVVHREERPVGPEGRRTIDLDLRHLVAGSYRVVVRAGALTTSAAIMLVR